MMTINRILITIAVDALAQIERSHGVDVARLIINVTDNHENMRRSIYVTLHRMVELGLLRSLRGNSRPWYKVTPKGRREMERTLAEFKALHDEYHSYEKRRQAA